MIKNDAMQINIKIESLFYVLAFFIACQIFTGSSVSLFNKIGVFSTLLVCFISIFLFIFLFKLKINKILLLLFVFFIFISFYFVFGVAMFNYPVMAGAGVVIQIFIIFIVSWLYVNCFDNRHVYFLSIVLCFFSLLSIALYICDIYFFANPNFYGMFVFSSLAFVVNLRKKIRPYLYMLFIVGLVVSGARAAQLSACVFLILLFFEKKWFLTQRKNTAMILLVMVILLCMLTPFVYISGVFDHYLLDINSVISSKNLESGRQIIWGYIMERFYVNPFLGYGIGNMPESYSNIYHRFDGLSAHNYFLQIAYQSGLVGVGLIIFTLSNLYLYLIKVKTAASLSSSAFLIAIFIHQSFEVSLTQNNFSIGILLWLGMLNGARFKVCK